MNPQIFFELAIDGETPWWRMLLDGLQFTLWVALWAWLLAMTVGVIVGVIRTMPRLWLARCGDAWVELFRNVPLIVQFFVWYFVLPGLFLPLKVWVTSLDPTEHQFITSILCLGLFTSARIAEQVKAGLLALPIGQRLAGLALGLTEWQTYRYVRLPMAFRIIIPPLTSDTMSLIKNTSVAYSIGLTELFFRTREMGEITFRYFEAFAAATVIYIAISLLANRVMALIERRVRVPGYIGGGR
jgi:glutamate/aspartate transport system permease protein